MWGTPTCEISEKSLPKNNIIGYADVTESPAYDVMTIVSRKRRTLNSIVPPTPAQNVLPGETVDGERKAVESFGRNVSII